MAEKQTNKERLKDITDSIERGIQDLFQSDKYAEYLRTMSRFHKYSVNNTMLIYIQKPDATLVAGFNKWRDQFERNVMKGEKGIKIIAPTPYKKKIEQEKRDPDTNLPITKKVDKALRAFYQSKEPTDLLPVVEGLNELAPKHIYFELLRLSWLEKLEAVSDTAPGDYRELLPHKKISHLCSDIGTLQKQIKGLIARVLDVDGEKEPVMQKMAEYYAAEGEDTLNTFRFRPQSTSFEVIDKKVFAEVLYPDDIYDLIDFHVRECVKREVKMRVCKNCLRYFAVTRKASTEYCDRVCDSRSRTCREMGAVNTWTQSKRGDEVFKEYRREYKKRFARINAGKLTKTAFYAWSEEARRRKADCDSGAITAGEFSRWLKESE